MKHHLSLTLSTLLTATVGLGTPLFAETGTDGATAQPAGTATSQADGAATAQAQGLSKEQLEALLAPIALYPDALLAQILMAATYPLDVVQGARWVKENEGLKGEELQKAAEKEPFDVSVQTLAHFPTVLQHMSDNLDWTQDLGEAYLGQETEVTDTIQHLRQQAMAAGNLESNDKQQVIKEENIIVVQPADPKVVYVPTYTHTVYQTPPPTTYYPSTVYIKQDNSTENFLAGAIVGGMLTAAIIWSRNDKYCCGIWYGGPPRWGGVGYWGRPGYGTGGWRRPVVINGNVNIGNKVGSGNVVGSGNRWNHDVKRRGNINYRNQTTRAKFSANAGVVNRDVARGRLEGKRNPSFGDIKIGDGKLNGKIGSAPATRPANRDLNLKGKAATQERKITRPASPAKRDIKLDRPNKATPRPAKKPQISKPNRPTTGAVKNRGNHAFKPSKAANTRAASNRGNRSVKRSGGGGIRAGGGGLRR